MIISRAAFFQSFKYSVYALLSLNVFFFGREEFLAAQLQFSDGIALVDIIEAYAATIDTAAWVVLLLMFELETYVLEDRHFTRRVSIALHGVRFVCYSFILYAFYGYIINVFFIYDVAPLPNVTDLCTLAVDQQWFYAIDLDEYTTISTANCASFTESTAFARFGSLPAVVDLPGLVEVQRLAWVDAINAAVWILVVVILEVDVRLQDRNRFEGKARQLSNFFKVALYSILLAAAIYWGFKGDFVDFWDALLWLLAFFFIEMNVVEWREEAHQEQAAISA